MHSSARYQPAGNGVVRREPAGQTGPVARRVIAWVTLGEEYLGAAGPFAVPVPWWAEVAPVVARLEAELRVPVLVLRMLGVSGGEGARDGVVTYHVEAMDRPASGVLDDRPVDLDALTRPHPLRAPWARADGVRELLAWAHESLAGLGQPVTGPVRQHRTWNLAGLFRLPTAEGPVWLKALPAFAADEAAVIGALDPGVAAPVLAAAPGRLLMRHVPGEDCWQAPEPVITEGIHRWVAAQAALAAQWPAGLTDRRTPVLTEQVGRLLDDLPDLTSTERRAARPLLARWSELDGCGLPNTVVHGDFHPGNWRSTGASPVFLDFADAHVGSPVLDGLRLIDFLPEPARPAATRAWIAAWSDHLPDAEPDRALTIAQPLAHLTYAVRYQEFLDGIEPDEHLYHLGDPAAGVRAAVAQAAVTG
jgi:hypothetical protein